MTKVDDIDDHDQIVDESEAQSEPESSELNLLLEFNQGQPEKHQQQLQQQRQASLVPKKGLSFDLNEDLEDEN